MSYYMNNNSVRSDIPVIRLGTSSSSFSSSGIPLFVYIFLFLVLFAVVFFVFRWLKSLLPKGGLLGEDNPILKPSDELDKEVADRSKDKMSSGEFIYLLLLGCLRNWLAMRLVLCLKMLMRSQLVHL